MKDSLTIQITPAELQAGDVWNGRLITAVGIMGNFVYADFLSGQSATFVKNGTILIERRMHVIQQKG